jgi:hypothetical protein
VRTIGEFACLFVGAWRSAALVPEVTQPTEEASDARLLLMVSRSEKA